MNDAAVTHIAGMDIHWGTVVRQRCSWCGILIIDDDTAMIAQPIEQADMPFPVWPVGALIEVTDSTFPKMYSIIEGDHSITDSEGIIPPKNCCLWLPVDLTRSVA